jgi:hypothetical protein
VPAAVREPRAVSELPVVRLAVIMLKSSIDRYFVAFGSIDQPMLFGDAAAPESMESMFHTKLRSDERNLV